MRHTYWKFDNKEINILMNENWNLMFVSDKIDFILKNIM